MVSLNTVLARARPRLETVKKLQRRAGWISRLRLGVAAVGVLVVAQGIEGGIAISWALAPLFVFVILAIVHEQTWRKIRRDVRIAEFHHRVLSRMEADVSGDDERPRSLGEGIRNQRARPRPGLREEELMVVRRDRVARIGKGRIAGLKLDEHLGLFGSGELFDRIADHRTDAGGETLASWMLRPATHRESARRQEAIRELAPRVEIREAVVATGCLDRWPARHGVLAGWSRNALPAEEHGEALAWRRLAEAGELGGDPEEAEAKEAADGKSESPPPSPERVGLLTVLAGMLGVANASGLALWLAGLAGPAPLAASLLLSMLVGAFVRQMTRSAEADFDRLESEVEGLKAMALALGEADFESEALRELRDRIRDAERPLRRLGHLRTLFAVRRNLMFTPVAALLFWGTHFALLLHRWRSRHETDLGRWSAAAGEFDALLALSQYADERPADEYPEYDEKRGFAAIDLGHPLIPRERLARNSLTLGRGDADFLIITGSNMSGKSTLLRAIGANFVLARLGAPVTASRFRLGQLALGPSISSHDSLRDGVSRFLAELFSLRAVLEAGAAGAPLLCLLDEVLEGTNSSDRRAAVRALLEELGRRGAVGILTTHDLTLTDLARELPGRIRNMHLTEQIQDGVMRFDFQLREGVLAQGNALELMRILNLPTPGSESAEYTALPDLRAGQEN